MVGASRRGTDLGTVVPGMGGVGRSLHSSPSGSLASGTAWVGLCVLILVAPFEETQPLFTLPGHSVSNVEAVLFIVLGAWAASLAWTRARLAWAGPALSSASPMSTMSTASLAGPNALTLPWIALLMVMLVAAWGAPTNRVNALHMVGRFGLALGVYLLTLTALSSVWRVRAVFGVAGLTGVLVGGLAILEYLGVVPVVQALTAFRPAAFLFGAQVRATGPFLYPTVSSMYLEVLFALTAGALLLAIDTGRRTVSLVVGLALIVIGEAVVLTLTRSGLISLASTLVIIGVLRSRQRGLDAGVKALALVGATLLVLLASSRSFEVWRLRLTTEGVSGYAARFEAPRELAFSSGATLTVPLTVTNTGRTTWDPDAPQRFRVSYHWLLEDEDSAVSWEGLRTPLPSAVAPGQRISLEARVKALDHPGRYRLLWDVEEEHRRWFSREPGTELFMSTTTVSGPPGAVPLRRGVSLPRRAQRPGRLVLWSAGGRMLAERPLLGVGPDNFRHLYGPYAGLTDADPRVHSNNMYLEILVGGGALAGAALAWFLWRAGRAWLALGRLASVPQVATVATAVLAAGTSVAGHGLVDSFLSFTATYILIAMSLGLMSACETLGASCAHRV